MNSKSNLQNALKNAFENHEVPLREAQWHRLEGVLVNTKPKWRIFPFLIAFLLVGITSISTYFLTLKYGSSTAPIANESSLPLDDNSHNNNNNNNPPQTTVQPFLKSNSANSIKLNKPYNRNSIAFQTQKYFNKQNSIIPRKSLQKNTTIPIIPVLLADNSGDVDNSNSIETYPLNSEEKPNNSEIIDEDLLSDSKKIEPASPTNDPKDKEKDSKPNKPSRMVVSISGGYSKMNVKIKDIDSENKLHKDTRSLFEQSNKNSKTFFFNLGMDYSLLPGINLGLNTGVQYLRITTPININYQITQVPFYNIDGTILGYYNADSADAIELRTTSTNVSNFINIPLRLNYVIPINFKNEILFTAGANIMAIVGANGKDVAINESQVKPLNKKTYSQFSAGFLGGVQYSHQLKDPWWLGVETQWSSNKLSFKTGPGSINTQLNGYRLNLILKYKI